MRNIKDNFRLILLFFEIFLATSFIMSIAFGSDDIERGESDIKLFQSLFWQKRMQHVTAVKNLLKYKYEMQYSLVLSTLEKGFETIISNKAVVENSSYIPGLALPKDDLVMEALAQIVENTALFAELQLKIPDITDRIMTHHQQWMVLIHWAIGFSNSTRLYDYKATQLINLVAQEMNLTKREPTYFNPYRKEIVKGAESTPPAVVNQKKKEKVKQKRGPKLSKPHVEL